ncbi:MAG: hypothetical protein R3E86_08820 [Pseudomonadales bacterium]
MDHQAFAQMLGNYGEFIGAIAVVVTLVYLAIQVRQQNLESRAKSVHEILWGFRDAQAVFGHPQAAQLAARVMREESLDSLDDEELLRAINLVIPMFRVWEEAFHYYKGNRLDPEIWESIVAQNLQVLGMHWGREMWALRRHVFTKSFAAFVDTLEPQQYRLRVIHPSD